MATIKVFDVNGVKELKCFDTLDNVAYLVPEIVESATDPTLSGADDSEEL